MISVHVGSIIVTFDDLDGRNPYMTIRQMCETCGAEIAVYSLDLREAQDTIDTIGELLGMTDANAAIAHLRDVHGYTEQSAPAPFICPLCHRGSWNPNDAINSYCNCCGSDTLPKYCEHRPVPRD